MHFVVLRMYFPAYIVHFAHNKKSSYSSLSSVPSVRAVQGQEPGNDHN